MNLSSLNFLLYCFLCPCRYKGVKASYASMTSIAMDVADACPAEDFIAVLIQYLVDPKLQRKSSDKGATSQIEQESIAKQLFYCTTTTTGNNIHNLNFYVLRTFAS
uniref:DUF7913 domain-containing protein n=2 Tax=Salix viminalis TaxID=40686 RepID=A0A6N2MG45_SALVM